MEDGRVRPWGSTGLSRVKVLTGGYCPDLPLAKLTPASESCLVGGSHFTSSLEPPSPTVRQVRLVRGLQEVEAKEQGTASMDVELSHADVEGSWTRDGLRLQPGPKCHLAVQGPVHILTLSALQPQDSGLVAFRAEGVHTSARLIVTGE